MYTFFSKLESHIKNFKENFKGQFRDLRMKIPKWIISPVDTAVESINVYTFLKEEFVEMIFDI